MGHNYARLALMEYYQIPNWVYMILRQIKLGLYQFKKNGKRKYESGGAGSSHTGLSPCPIPNFLQPCIRSLLSLRPPKSPTPISTPNPRPQPSWEREREGMGPQDWPLPVMTGHPAAWGRTNAVGGGGSIEQQWATRRLHHDRDHCWRLDL